MTLRTTTPWLFPPSPIQVFVNHMPSFRFQYALLCCLQHLGHVSRLRDRRRNRTRQEPVRGGCQGRCCQTDRQEISLSLTGSFPARNHSTGTAAHADNGTRQWKY